MRPCLVLFLFFFVVRTASAQTPTAPPFALAHFAVTTTIVQAQHSFDEGLTLLYAFNPAEARRRFQHAAALDPSCAMARWGIAMSWGVNVNSDFDPADQRHGRAAIAQAVALMVQAAPLERGLIGAASERFAFDRNADAARSATAYRDTMNAVARAFPDNDDVQALAAEAAMDVTPWAFWTKDGKPAAGTPGIVARLEDVLARDPGNIGANHFLIHTLEQSPHPEGAQAAADRLAAMPFEPAAEHLTHMPAHIYMQVGEYHAAGEVNVRALDMFDAYLDSDHATGHEGYRSHDCTFVVEAFMMSGERDVAERSAARCARRATLKGYVAVRFRRWADLSTIGSDQHFAHGMAAAVAGRASDAESDARALEASKGAVAQISALLIRAKLAASRGQRDVEIAALRRAVEIQDRDGYSEPPEFFFPVRESLGGALLRAGRFDEAVRTFSADLARNPKNPRSLFGYAASLRSQGLDTEAVAAQQAFTIAWRYADSPLDIKDL